MSEATIKIAGKDPFPEVNFDFQANRFSLSGTCYPEDVREFFSNILARFENHLSGLSGETIWFELRLAYFNSSATRVFIRIFDLLENCAEAGNTVSIQWLYEEGDENMEELAEEFAEEFEAASFEVKAY